MMTVVSDCRVWKGSCVIRELAEIGPWFVISTDKSDIFSGKSNDVWFFVNMFHQLFKKLTGVNFKTYVLRHVEKVTWFVNWHVIRDPDPPFQTLEYVWGIKVQETVHVCIINFQKSYHIFEMNKAKFVKTEISLDV